MPADPLPRPAPQASPRDDDARAQSMDGRRGGQRRRAGARRLGSDLPDGGEAGGRAHTLVSPEWGMMGPAFAIGLVLLAIAGRSLPHLSELAMGLGATGLASATPFWLRLESRVSGNLGQRMAVMLLAVTLPMLLFGAAVADWTDDVERDVWAAAVGVLAIVSTFGAILNTGRLPAIATATFALWCTPVVASGSLSSLLVLAVAVAGSLFILRRQMRLDREAKQRASEAERRQTRAEEILSDYEQTGQGWFWETDRRGTITYLSETVARALGRQAEAFVGRPFAEIFVLDSGSQDSERTLNFHLSARSSFTDLALRAAIPDEERWWSISGRPVHDEFQNFVGFRGSGSDLTEKRRSQEHATRLAHFDSLTGLANRFQMAQTLEKILAAIRVEHRACAVFLLDLDRFKQVNDTMGHPAGDALLKQVAQRLEHTVGDAGRVGRLGGDEFQVILPGRIAREHLAHLAERIIANLSQPYLIEHHRVVIGASVGIALSPDDGVTSEALIRNADLALYAAKDGGRGRHHFYAADLHSDAEERREMEQSLRDALVNGGLELHYQPVVHTTTEKITGFEALLRWHHPVHGYISPARFIPIAEDAGLIAQIGEWALRTACADLARWPASVRVAVNVSPLQFANPALPAIVTSALAAAQVDPARLELEITESVFLNDDEGIEAMFASLKRVGVRLALDDFGTGYSSLGYLKRAPFDKIKIDQSFVRGATIQGSRNGAIISSIVSLAEALGMETTAEGVETLDELDLVRMLGCSHVQGYIYEKALDADAAEQRLRAGLQAVANGPRSARAVRQTMLRKVLLEHNGERYEGTIRNISQSGALIEGLWNVPPGTIFGVALGEGRSLTATARWCQDDRMGLEFSAPISLDEVGRVNLAQARRPTLAVEPPLQRRAG